MHSNCTTVVHVHVLMRDEKEGRRKQGQTHNKAKQHSTPKAVKKNELPRVGLPRVCCVALLCCLYDLACFFLPSDNLVGVFAA